MTFGECITKTRKLINYYSIAGSRVLDSDETQTDYTARAAAAIDTAQKELAAVCPLVKHTYFVQRPIRPLAMCAKPFTLNGSFELTAEGARAFSFMADGDVQASLAVWEYNHWHEKLVVADVAGDELKTVYGELDSLPSDKDRVRLTLTGQDVEIFSPALYRSFPQHEDIPVMGNPRRHSLPPNFSRVAMISALPFKDRVRKTAFYAVDGGKISFPWEFCGKIDMAYEVFPRTVTENSSYSFNIELPENAAEVIPCFAAAMLLTDEDPKLSSFFLKMYNERRASLLRPGAQCVVNTLWR